MRARRGDLWAGPGRLGIALVVVVLGALALAALWPGGAAAAPPAVTGEQVRAVAEKLQCPVCQGISVADSNSQVAQDMRAVIRAKLEAGESEKEILGYFQERYGPGILREPPRTGLFSAVWWMPGVALAVGAAIILGMMRRRAPTEVAREESPRAEEEMSEEEIAGYRQRIRDMVQGGLG